MKIMMESLFNEYVKWKDFKVLENANRYLGPTGFFTMIAEESMEDSVRNLIPKDIYEAHASGMIYIHKLPFSIYIPYCTGHSLSRLLKKGLRTPTVVSKPARHFDTLVDHVTNFLTTMQHYFTGAQAISSFEWFAGPFIRRDGLGPGQIRQQLQRMLYNLNYPTRVGMQCLSQDTRILTPEGWKGYGELKEGVLIYTFNMETKRVEVKPVKRVAIYSYRGKMYRLRGRYQDQLVSPHHRVVWLSPENRVLVKFSPIEDLLHLGSPIPVPTPAYAENSGEDYPVPDDVVKLAAWFLTIGGIRRAGRKGGEQKRVVFRLSRTLPPGCQNEVAELLSKLGLRYVSSNGRLTLDAESSRKLLEMIGVEGRSPPGWLFRLSRRQARLFIETYARGCGWAEYRGGAVSRRAITAGDPLVRDALAATAVLAGFNVVVRTRKPRSPSRREHYVLVLSENEVDYIGRIDEVDYEGVIWSVNTDNETVIAERNGFVFITGNTPFTNFTITMDAPRRILERTPGVHGGAEVEPLFSYEEEAKRVVVELARLYFDGDALGQPFTFPIPTLMTTARWLWDDPEVHEAVFRTASAKGSFYWLNTNMLDPNTSFSMCLHHSELVLFRVNGKIFASTIGALFRKVAGEVESTEPGGATWYKVAREVEVLSFSLRKGTLEWRKVKRFLVKKSSSGVQIKLADGRSFVVTHDHPLLVRRSTGVELTSAKALLDAKSRGEKVADFRVPVVLSDIPGTGEYVKVVGSDGTEVVVNEDLAYLLGVYYASPGKVIANIRGDDVVVTGLEIPVNKMREEELLKKLMSIGTSLAFIHVLTTRSKWKRKKLLKLFNRSVVGALVENGLSVCPKIELYIPWFIWTSPLRVRQAFVRGFIESCEVRVDTRYDRLITHPRDRRYVKMMMLLAAISSISVSRYDTSTKKRCSLLTPSSLGGEDSVKHHVKRSGCVVWVRIRDVEEVKFDKPQLYVDVELEGDDHYFVHSEGVVSHNCCRISIDMSELAYAYNNSKPSFSLRKNLSAVAEEYWKGLEKQMFGGIWSVPDITGSIIVVDVNLPRLALESKNEESAFWELYRETLSLVKTACNWFRLRYTHILRWFPTFYSMIVEYMPEFPAYHFNSVGLVGLPEAAAILMGNPKLWFDGSRSDWLRAAELMRKMVEFAVDEARSWMREEGTPWNVEEVPGESVAAKLAVEDLRRHPELAEYLPDPGNPVYSTSIAPYYSPMELLDRVEVEQRVQKYFTGGVMLHIFLDEEPDPEALASLTKKLAQTELVYWSYTPALTFCNRCNRSYTGLYTACPRCGSPEVEVWSRIVGYYRPLRNWNPSRKKEFWTRHHIKIR